VPDLPPPQPSGKRVWTSYRRRPSSVWRAARGDALDNATVDWLTRLLNEADRSVVLSDWECSFCIDFDRRFKRFGRLLRVSPKQLDVLRRIEAKLAGRRA
jgi:hypothetical protein